jgi:hypothetical protein
MKRILVPIIVVVVLVIGYGAGQLTAPKASAPVSLTSPTIPTRPIEPSMPTGTDSTVASAPQPSPVTAPSVQAWYGPDRHEVMAAEQKAIDNFRNVPQEHSKPIQPLNVQ